MFKIRSTLIVVLAILGIYFSIAHASPLPFNHESIGLGTNHFLHTFLGLVLFVAAGFIWLKDRKK